MSGRNLPPDVTGREDYFDGTEPDAVECVVCGTPASPAFGVDLEGPDPDGIDDGVCGHACERCARALCGLVNELARHTR